METGTCFHCLMVRYSNSWRHTSTLSPSQPLRAPPCPLRLLSTSDAMLLGVSPVKPLKNLSLQQDASSGTSASSK